MAKKCSHSLRKMEWFQRYSLLELFMNYTTGYHNLSPSVKEKQLHGGAFWGTQGTTSFVQGVRKVWTDQGGAEGL